MRGRKKHYVVELTESERAELSQLSSARNTPQGIAIRAKIILTADDHKGWSDQRIATVTGVSEYTVRKWRRRWVENHSLEELPRGGRPRQFGAEVRAQITALACTNPQGLGMPLARWSFSELAMHLLSLGVVVSIATSTICRWLKAERVKPWRYHFWQKVIDPSFLALATPVLRLYEQAKSLLAQGIWVVCVDEKTSIQAREGIHTPEPATPDNPVHIAARYLRHGALQFFTALSVAEGYIFGCCRKRKTFADFQAFFLEVLVPEALKRGIKQLSLILDNGTTHAPKQLKKWLDEQKNLHQWPFSVKLYWLPKYASWLNQIEIFLSIFQRKLLTPNHFASLRALMKAIMAFIDHYNATAKPIKWSYTVEKLEKKFGTN